MANNTTTARAATPCCSQRLRSALRPNRPGLYAPVVLNRVKIEVDLYRKKTATLG